jgi:hypothetical protein
MKSAGSRFRGRWKIVWMEMWDQDYVDEDVPGHVTFDEKGGGEFQFGYVYGSFAWSTEDKDVDAPWEGNEEMDPAHGSISCRIESGELHGIIRLFSGDKSAFRAVWENK